MKQERKMTATVKSAARALAIGFVLAAAGSAPAWSQSLIGDGVSANAYGTYYRSAPYAYAQPDAYAPRLHRQHR
jgi:hypothetical protein